MADTKISQLPVAEALAGTEVVPVVQSAATKAATITQILSAAQPLDSDLTAIAALATTPFGRSLLTLVDAAAGRTALELGTAATTASSDYDPAGSAAAAAAASQPLDGDLTAIAALATTAYGRAFLTLADGPALRAVLGTGTADATTFLRGDGTWQVPPGGGGGGAPTDATYVTLTANGTLSGEKVLADSVIMAGTLAARPAPSADNAGALYFATDDDGGTLTRSNGASWTNVAPGLTEAPPQHGFARHAPGGADSWTQVTRRTTNHAGVTNSTALVNSGLSVVGAADEVWLFEARVFYTASATGDIKVGWSVPAGVTGQWGAHALVASAASNPSDVNVKATDYAGTIASGGSGAAELMIVLSGLMVFGATPGTANLQIAQNTSDATATIALAHSHLLATRVA